MASKKNITRVLISIIFIAYGVSSVLTAIKALLSLELAAVLGCALGILMFVTGILGILRTKIKICRILGVIICILSALKFAMALAGGAFAVDCLVQALLAWKMLLCETLKNFIYFLFRLKCMNFQFKKC